MGWEMRGCVRVYYRKVREGVRVRSIYCGSGTRGEQAAREDRERRSTPRVTPPAETPATVPAVAVLQPSTASAPVAQAENLRKPPIASREMPLRSMVGDVMRRWNAKHKPQVPDSCATGACEQVADLRDIKKELASTPVVQAENLRKPHVASRDPFLETYESAMRRWERKY